MSAGPSTGPSTGLRIDRIGRTPRRCDGRTAPLLEDAAATTWPPATSATPRPPLRPGGAGRRPQAPGHVHRLDRRARADPLPVGDHRQRRRRGARRAFARGSTWSCTTTTRSGTRQRPRHPGRHGAQDGARRRRAVLDAAACPSGKFGGGSYAVSGGLHGVGASVVNALSARLDVEVDRDGATHVMSFRRGACPAFSTATALMPTSRRRRACARSSGSPKRVSGTRVRYWVDRQIFLRDAALSLHGYTNAPGRRRFWSQVAIAVRDERPGAETVQEVFAYDGGISEFCEFLARPGDHRCPAPAWQRPLPGDGPDPRRAGTPGAGRGGARAAGRHRVAMGYEYDAVVRTFVNIIATPRGGTHLQGFERGLVRTLNEQLRATKLLRVGEDAVLKDVVEGLTAVVTVRIAEPQFEGQTKEVLGTSAATGIVQGVVQRELTKALTSGSRARPRAGSGFVLEKVLAARTRIAARQHPGDPATEECAGGIDPARQARRLSQRGRRPFGAVHRRGRLGARHGEAGAQLGVPGAAPDSRQDPQRPEVVRLGHAEER